MGLLVSVIYRVTHVDTALLRCMNNVQTILLLKPRRQVDLQIHCLKMKQPFGTECGLDESLVEDPELSQRAFLGNIVAVRNIADHTHIMFCVLRQA